MAEKKAEKKRPVKNYRVVRFEAENIKRVKCVIIEPGDSPVIEITGDNENGKTSVLDALWWAFSGEGKIQENPISDGAEEGHIFVDIGDMTVQRFFNRKGDDEFTTRLVVEHDELGKIQGAQSSLLNSLVGKIAFDPLAFSKMKPKDQFDMLKSFVEDFDFDVVAVDRKKAFEARADAKRELASLEAQIAGMVIAEDVPEDPIDVNALATALREANDFNADIDTRRTNREQAQRDLVITRESVVTAKERAETRHRDKLEDLKAKYDEAVAAAHDELTAENAKIADTVDKADALEAKLASVEPLKDKIDTSAIIEQMQQANDINQQVQRKQMRNDLQAKANAQIKIRDDSDAEIERLDKIKLEAVSSAKIPVEDIGFGEDSITLKGQPFEQASAAQQLKASIAISAASNPRLRVIRILDGSLLDKKNFEVVKQMATDLNLQVWIETVDSSRPSAWVIEDGAVASQGN